MKVAKTTSETFDEGSDPTDACLFLLNEINTISEFSKDGQDQADILKQKIRITIEHIDE